jgi:ribosomal protein L11 methyltransferase
VLRTSETEDTIDVPPRWQILAPEAVARGGTLSIRLVSGPGFGDGKHPTTQLCLQAMAALAPRGRPWRLLDVGSGSAILSIAGALLGASVDAVEIDERAIGHAAVNLAASGVAAQVRQVRTLAQAGARFDLVVANILRPVLLDLAKELAPKREGSLVLSGLVSTDVPETSARYARLLGRRPEIYEADEWRALVWRPDARHPLG